MKKMFFATVAVLAFTGCGNNSPKQQEPTLEPTSEKEELNAFFSKDEKAIYFTPCHSEEAEAIEGADVESFQVLGEEYAKDEAHVYSAAHCDELEVLEVDTPSFTLLKQEGKDAYAKDKNAVYFLGGETSPYQFTILEGADPETFELVDDKEHPAIQAKDKNTVYLLSYSEGHGTQFLKADVASFEILNLYYAKDKNQVWKIDGGYVLYYLPLEDADESTFQVLEYAYAKDKANVYGYRMNWESFDILKIEEAEVSTFTPLNEFVSKDKNQVYIQRKPFAVSDVTSFSVYGPNPNPDAQDFLRQFYHDAQSVYFFVVNSGYKLDEIDVDTAEVIYTESPEQPLVKDKNHVYLIQISPEDEVGGEYDLQVVPLEVDTASFEYLGGRSYRDKNGEGTIDWETGTIK